MKKKEEIIQRTAEKLLKLLEIGEPKISLKKDENGIFNLSIETEDSGVLIGFHGETIYAFQLILNLIVYKELKEWQRIIVDVGDWRRKREEQLKRMALAAAQRAKFSGERVIISHLNSSERRIVHITLADNPEIITQSEGEGRERRLVVESKK